jgi:hypothetical protein
MELAGYPHSSATAVISKCENECSRMYADGKCRLWAQRLRPDMRPDGKPAAVYPSGPSQRSPVIATDDIGVGPHRIVFTQVERTGNIWLLEPPKRDAR